ncbi:MAG: tetratricopeptide repeat protein [Thermoanaerobaculales bacterium]|nr:tetratricopeptide repeat protein [Thermoanaerobaculales bacterium]
MRNALIIIVALSTIACTGGEDIALLHREITDVQRGVQNLQNSNVDQQDMRQLGDRLQQLTDQNMRSNADLSTRVQALQESIEALHASLELTTRKLQAITQELAAARAHQITVLPPVTTTVPAGADGEATTNTAETASIERPVAAAIDQMPPDRLYRSAYEDYMRGNYDLAAQGFREYLRRFPETDLGDNALYWIGEAYDAQDLNQEAIEVFSQLLEAYPNSDKAAGAQLKKGLLYLKADDQGQGVVNLQYVVYEHPGTKEAELAREKLRSLGLNIR